MKSLTLESESGDVLYVEYESYDELYINKSNGYPAVLYRDDVIELIGFLSQFVDQELDEEI